MRTWKRSQVGGEALQARPADFHPGTPHQLLGRTLYPYRPLSPLTFIISHSSPAFIGHLSMETHCTIPSDCSLLSETLLVTVFWDTAQSLLTSLWKALKHEERNELVNAVWRGQAKYFVKGGLGSDICSWGRHAHFHEGSIVNPFVRRFLFKVFLCIHPTLAPFLYK